MLVAATLVISRLFATRYKVEAGVLMPLLILLPSIDCPEVPPAKVIPFPVVVTVPEGNPYIPAYELLLVILARSLEKLIKLEPVLRVVAPARELL
jgi:hypothetical protein